MNKRVLVCLLMLLVMLTIAGACAAPAAPAPVTPESPAAQEPPDLDPVDVTGTRERVTIWMAPDDGRFTIDSGLPQRFNELHPQWEVEIVTMPWDTMHNSLMMGFAGGELPALSQAAFHWLGTFKPLGTLRAMDEYKANNNFTDDMFLPYSWEHYRGVSGSLYAAPFAWGPRALFYRTDILQEAGFDGPPETWDEMFEWGAAIGNGVDRFALAPLDAWLDFHFYSTLLYGHGGLIVDETGTSALLETPEALQALEVYARLYEENVIPRDPAHRVDALQGFIEGYYAMVHTGTWWFGLLGTQAPELDGVWNVALLPEGTTTTTFGHCNPWIIPVNPQNPDGVNSEAAEAWLTFLFDVENAIQLSRYFGQLPPMIAAYEHPFLRDNPHVMVFYEALTRGVNSLRNVNNAEAASEVVWNMLADVRDGVSTPQAALESANAQINNLIRQ
ncbi:MAG: extracellular solute-binding protein [Oscillospiraceae bacterium]|nr:extracellular solute-binding protein [Oscillospiraceae bacterium]